MIAITSPSSRTRRRTGPGRRGLTLYEVMISLAIFLPALAVLGQAVTHGGRAAVQAQLQTEAILRADSVMGELIAGAQPLSAISGSLFEDGAPGWTWSLQVTDGPLAGLLRLEVTVTHVDSTQKVNARATIVRYLRDPQLTSGTTTGMSTF